MTSQRRDRLGAACEPDAHTRAAAAGSVLLSNGADQPGLAASRWGAQRVEMRPDVAEHGVSSPFGIKVCCSSPVCPARLDEHAFFGVDQSYPIPPRVMSNFPFPPTVHSQDKPEPPRTCHGAPALVAPIRGGTRRLVAFCSLADPRRYPLPPSNSSSPSQA